jgi:hypothetical protein
VTKLEIRNRKWKFEICNRNRQEDAKLKIGFYGGGNGGWRWEIASDEDMFD